MCSQSRFSRSGRPRKMRPERLTVVMENRVPSDDDDECKLTAGSNFSSKGTMPKYCFQNIFGLFGEDGL